MKPDQTLFDVVILGAGGAGFMCAMTAAKRGRTVLLLDHADKAGKKILISGGGRCNFTNLDARPECYISRNPHFVKSALARYTQHDFIGLINLHGIEWHEKTLGQLFCDGSSRQIIDMLLSELSQSGAELLLSTSVENITRDETMFRVETSAGQYECHNLVIATGGKSLIKSCIDLHLIGSLFAKWFMKW